MDYLVCYDIADTPRRNRVARVLDDYGRRVQESVFELAAIGPELLDACRKRLLDAIEEPEGDTVRIYGLCARCRETIIILGRGAKPMDNPEVYIL